MVDSGLNNRAIPHAASCMLSAVKIASSRTASTPAPAAAPADTPDKLIAAAERLFAEHGYTNVSVRAIAAAAGVNWSLVGYYFRGKEGLLSEVYRRHCSSLNAERLKLLGQARRKGLELEAVIEAFVRPALAEIQTGHGETSFSRLRAILAAEDSALLNQLVADNFDMSSRTFVAALRQCLPDVPADEILWRFHFMLGTIYYSVASPQRIKTFSKGRCDPGNLEDTLQHLVPFLAAAFRAPAKRGRKHDVDTCNGATVLRCYGECYVLDVLRATCCVPVPCATCTCTSCHCIRDRSPHAHVARAARGTWHAARARSM